MSEEAKEYSLPESEESAEETQPVREAEDRPVGITREDFEQFVNRIDDKLNRFSQSLTDRTEDRVKKALDSKMKQLDAFFETSSVAPEDQETIRKQVRAEVLKEEAFKAVKQEPEPAKQNNAEVEAVNRRVTELLDTMGVEFKEGDKELEMIVNSGSAKDYEKSVIKAATQWLVRKNSEKSNPEARIPGIVSGSTSAKDLKTEYNKEIRAAQSDPINGVEKALQVRRKYRNLGLPV